jgi:hypothetical protein
VTNVQTMAAFDVRPDGALSNQREFAKLPAGSGLLPTASCSATSDRRET